MAAFLTRIRPHLLPLALLTLGIVLVYAPSLGHDFLTNWDDRLYVTGNPDILGLNFGNIANAFTSFYVGNYAPLHIVSYMLDYELWGLDPFGFILTNIILHTLNGFLFYALLVRRGLSRAVAFCAVFLFLFHPVQAESVNWISQRKNLLAMLFFLASFHLFTASRGRDGRRRVVLYAASLGAFIAALLAKSIAVILPLALLLDDACFPDGTSWWRRIGDKVPFFVCAAAITIISFVSQDGSYSGGRVGYYGGSFAVQALTMLPVFPQYLVNLFLPVNLSIIYGFPVRQEIDLQVALAVMLALLFILVGARLYRKRRPLFFWFALFFVGLLPVANIVPITTFMNDRYLYFPMLGFAPFMALLFAGEGGMRLRWRPVLLGLLLLPLPFLTWKRGEAWRDSVSLWTDAEAKSVEGVGYGFSIRFASQALAEAYYREGAAAYEKDDTLAARALFLRALAHDPEDHNSLSLLAMIYLREGRPLLARPYLLRLTDRFKRSSVGYRNLGFSYLMTAEYDKAADAFRHVLELEPDNAQVREYLTAALRNAPARR